MLEVKEIDLLSLGPRVGHLAFVRDSKGLSHPQGLTDGVRGFTARG
jgi:hypothetical protein